MLRVKKDQVLNAAADENKANFKIKEKSQGKQIQTVVLLCIIYVF